MTFKEAGEHFKSTIHLKGTLRDDFESVIGESLRDRRLVLFIDDLDRCLPEKTIKILEVIKLFLDLPGSVCILSVFYRC
ncbi:MAG: P-loop NTPase fold protein [Methanosarcinales archaeon]